MKFIVKKGRTSLLLRVFIQDSSSTTGAGLSGLTSGSSGLVCYRARDDDGNAGATQLTLSAGTRGTWSSGGLVEKDSTNQKGVYELGIDNAGIAGGSESVTYYLSGATNMAPCLLEIQLVAFDPQAADANGFLKVDVEDFGGVAGTFSGGLAQVNAAKWAGGLIPTPNVTGVPKVDVVDWVGGAVPAPNVTGEPLVDVNHWRGAQPSALNSGTVQADVERWVNAAPAALVNTFVPVSVSQWGGTAVAGAIPPDAVFLRSGTAQGGAASSITLDAGASAVNNYYQNAVVFIRSGTGAGQCALITTYVGSTKVATINGTWATNPDSTSVFSLLPFGSISATVSGNVTVGGYAAGQDPGTYVLVNPANKLFTDAANRVDVGRLLGTASAGAPGYAGLDWSKVNAPTTAVDLSGTTIKTLDNNPPGYPANFNLFSLDGSGRVDLGKIVGSAQAATNQQSAALALYVGAVTGTASSTTLVDSNLPATDANQLVGRVLIFDGNITAGLKQQATNITGQSSTTLTFTALTRAPAAGDSYRIV